MSDNERTVQDLCAAFGLTVIDGKITRVREFADSHAIAEAFRRS